MNWQERITIDPSILVGKPVIRGTRLAVELIVELLAQGWSEEEVLKNYPGITQEDMQACLGYARPRCAMRRSTRLRLSMRILANVCSSL
jgi:uncharacterized protein (DUF433 family)